ncbi:hypothetical protein F4778DRAFT_215871 [Xylariomycetidae sp. FL2044]|nr:hypothetical protein F4778DRAFT_215871 [Xylariomycetidae sp. FL2044]
MSFNGSDDEEWADVATSRPKAKKSKKPVAYPPDIPRLLRKGKGTYPVGCGPLPDDTDWTTISFPGLKEQCLMRDIPNGAAKQVLIDALTNYEEPDDTVVLESLDVVGKGKSASGEKRVTRYLDAPTDTYRRQLAKVQTEKICIVNMADNSEFVKTGGPSIQFTVASGYAGSYRVRISKFPECDCPFKKYQSDPICKHILYVVVHVLKAPEPLRWQTGFLSDELHNLFEPILQASPERSPKTSNYGTLSAAENCSVCFKDLDDNSEVVACLKCGDHSHRRCFNVSAHHRSGWEPLQCLSCHSAWDQEGNWGIEAENEGKKKKPRSRARKARVEYD